MEQEAIVASHRALSEACSDAAHARACLESALHTIATEEEAGIRHKPQESRIGLNPLTQ